MYDPTIIGNTLEKINPFVLMNTKAGQKKIPFRLEYHTPDEIDIMKKHLDEVINLPLYEATCETNSVKIEPRRNLTIDELIWIENEKILCKYDCNYFQDGYFKYLSAEGEGWKQFSPLTPHLVNRKIRARLQKAGRPIKKWTVKSRQQAESTDSQGVILHRLNYYKDVMSMIASHDADATAKLSDIFMKAMAQLPWWNRTFITKLNTHEEYYFDIGSLFDLGWGTQAKLGRGRTPLVSHISEIPFFKFPEESLEESLFNAMHENIWQIILAEGTAEKRGDYYHKKTQEVISGMEDGTGAFVICFHPACARDDLYPTKTWIHTRASAFMNWSPSSHTLAVARKLINWVKSNEDYRSIWGSNWQPSREFLFWYEIEKRNAEGRGRLQQFLKEHPTDIEEAFQNAGTSIYPLQTIISLSDNAQRAIPDIYKLRGDINEISPTLFPTEDEIDYEKPRIKITARWDTEKPPFIYELVPILFKGWDSFDPQNKILIWEHPKRGATYGMAVDDSDGLGKGISDDAVLEVIKKGTIEYKDKQVCEFASAGLPPTMLRPFNLAIASYFSPEEQLLFIPEVKKGTEVLNGMLNVGWRNVFGMIDSSRIDKDFAEIKKLGFDTNPRTRLELINLMNQFIMGNYIDINSMMLIQELKDLTKKQTVSPVLGMMNEKIMAAKGKSDNRFMSFGMCLYGLHRNEILGLEKAAWQERLNNENSVVVLQSYGGNPLDIIEREEDSSLVYNDEESEWEIDNLLNEVEEAYYQNYAYL